MDESTADLIIEFALECAVAIVKDAADPAACGWLDWRRCCGAAPPSRRYEAASADDDEALPMCVSISTPWCTIFEKEVKI